MNEIASAPCEICGRQRKKLDFAKRILGKGVSTVKSMINMKLKGQRLSKLQNSATKLHNNVTKLQNFSFYF